MTSSKAAPPSLLARVVFLALAAATLHPAVTASVGLIVGIAAALTFGNPYAKLTKKATATLLQLSVVALGFGMNLRVVLAAGLQGFAMTFAGIVGCFIVGALLRVLLRVPRDVGLLLTVGTAICGGSAIAAVVPAIGANDDDATVSLAVVFLLNALGLVAFPFIGHALGLDEARFGLWAALAIHDTSSVVGAASQYGKVALEVATTVKLARALWIVPLALLIGWWRSRSRSAEAGPRPSVKKPWFIVGFLAAAAVVTFVPEVATAGALAARGARQSLVLTLFLIGANLTRGALRSVGARPLAMGLALWVVVAAATLAALRLGLIS